MGLLEWFTGRNGIYKDNEAVQNAEDGLNNISRNDLATAKEEIAAAVNKLTQVRGFEKEVGGVDKNAFDPIVDVAKEGIDAVIAQIEAKVQDIEDFSNSSLGDKILATSAMVTAKVGEGFLGAFEDVGDGLLTVGAWVTNVPKLWTGEDTAASKAIKDFVKSAHSHEIFVA